MNKIELPITSVYVDKSQTADTPEPELEVVQASNQPGNVSITVPSLLFEDVLEGATIRLRGHGENSTFLTINHALVNGEYKPAQIFINSKDPEKFLMIQVMGTSASALCRVGLDLTFLAEEWINTRALDGYYYKGTWYDSWVSQVGHALKERLAYLKAKEVWHEAVASAEERNVSYAARESMPRPEVQSSGRPKLICKIKTCRSNRVVNTGNCLTCLECGDSVCG